MSLRVRKLRADDERSAFRSGNVHLDRFFVRYAGQNQFRHHIGTTYVAVDERERIAGFATVSASELAPGVFAKTRGLPGYPLPVLRLARLAVDEPAKGQGVGRLLLHAVFELARRMADDVGCFGLVVDAKPEAIPFYEKLGFRRLPVVAGQLNDPLRPQPMFLSLGQLPVSR